MQNLKSITLTITVLLQIAFIAFIKALDNLHVIITVLTICIAIGLAQYRFQNNNTARDIGYGLLFGSLISAGLFALFMVWLIYNFPK